LLQDFSKGEAPGIYCILNAGGKGKVMGYAHILNLYKNQDILIFKRCYAMEKIHGSSAHVSWKKDRIPQISFFSGGEKHENFVKIFDQENLLKKFEEMGCENVVVFGEVYGGKCQKMSNTYGKDMKFIAFDVKIGDVWLTVPDAAQVAASLGLGFVHYVEISTDLAEIDAQRDADSVQAVRNGMGEGHKREGVVLRPLIEVRKNNGERICAKHKRDDFSETKTPRKVTDEELQVLTEANAIADEWVTENRLSHVLQRFPNCGIQDTGRIIAAMVEDVTREAEGEITDNKEARKVISKRTAEMFKRRIKEALNDVK